MQTFSPRLLWKSLYIYVWIYENGAKDFDHYNPYFTLISLKMPRPWDQLPSNTS